MSRIYVDRISPYQSGSVQVDGLNLDTSSLATKVELNAYTASNDGKVNSLIAATSSYQPVGNYATTGSNTFNGTQTFNVGDGAFALRANFNNSFFYSAGSANVVGVLKNDFSEATTIGLGSGVETYNASADVGLTPNLTGLTSEGDDRPGLFAYSGSVARDVIALPKTSWDNGGQIEIKNPVKVNSNIEATGSLSLTEGINLSDNLIHYGNEFNSAQYRQNPNYFSEYYGNLFWWRPNFSGGQSQLILGEKTKVSMLLNAWSGSAYDNAFIPKVTSVGTEFADWSLPSYAETTWLSIPQQGNPAFQRSVEVTGSVSVSEVLSLQPQDPLPAGALGQLAVSGSDLYFHNGTNWVVK